MAERDGDAEGDPEGDYMRSFVNGKTLDVGCGGRKLHPDAIGVDVIPEGNFNYTPSQCGAITQASVLYDGKKLPFEDNSIDVILCRHVFEHFLSPWKILDDWHRVLKPDGIAVVALPDEALLPTIPLDPTHLHAYTPFSFFSFVERLGKFVMESSWPAPKGNSFVVLLRKQ